VLADGTVADVADFGFGSGLSDGRQFLSLLFQQAS